MKKVICFGEALIDFINVSSDFNNGLKLNNFVQYPGGAPANAAVAVAKLGGDAYFLGQVGDDDFGSFLQKSLKNYGVNTDFLIKHPTAKTALAFVLRDESGERSFSFYRDNSADVIFNTEQIDEAIFEESGIYHFCSNTLTDPIICQTTQSTIAMARSKGYLISFDVNLRHSLWSTGRVDIALTNSFVEQAYLLKFSKDELDYLCQGNPQSYIKQCLTNKCQLLLVTNDGKPIDYYTRNFSGTIAAPKVDVVDTTAGGDGFIGGLLFLLSKVKNISQLLHSEQQVKQLISFAAESGAIAVTRLGAFPALPVFEDVKHTYPDFL